MSRNIRPPNILYICCDQLAAASLQAYGCSIPSSPNIARLAARGRQFDRYYASTPVCAPNRACMLTGRSTWIHGMVTNNFALATDTPTYAHVLQRQGYRTGGFGKFHQTSMKAPPMADMAHLGFDESVVHEDPKWSPYLEWVATRAPEHFDMALSMAWGSAALYGLPDDLLRRYRLAAGAHRQRVLAEEGWMSMFESHLPAELHDSVYLTDMALDFIGRQPAERPFFCHLSYVDPHDPYDAPRGYSTLFPPESLPTPAPAEWRSQGPAVIDDTRDDYMKFRTICEDPAKVQRMRSLYHGTIAHLDEQIGRVLNYLDENQLWDDTIVVFASDHGEMIGEHGLITKGVKHWDHGIRCPLIVAGAGIGTGHCGDLACTLDLYPTFCEWAGAPAADMPPLEGRSLATACRHGAMPEPWPEVLSTFGEVSTVITDDGWRLTRFTEADEGQLFDLNSDPGEQRNLYAAPAHAERRLALCERMIRAIRRQSDLPQYRNLPAIDGVRMSTGPGEPMNNPRHPYDLPLAPYLHAPPRTWDPTPLAELARTIPTVPVT